MGSYQNADIELEKLKQRDKELRILFSEAAKKLSLQRNQAAKKLSKEINIQLTELGMANAKLKVEVSPIATSDPAAQGTETVEFLVSTNPGQTPKPLVKIASGRSRS